LIKRNAQKRLKTMKRIFEDWRKEIFTMN
jgi:hypothetical protein